MFRVANLWRLVHLRERNKRTEEKSVRYLWFSCNFHFIIVKMLQVDGSSHIKSEFYYKSHIFLCFNFFVFVHCCFRKIELWCFNLNIFMSNNQNTIFILILSHFYMDLVSSTDLPNFHNRTWANHSNSIEFQI